MSELIRYLRLGNGDRIGHGVVLGINAAEWATSTVKVAMTYEQRMLDLCWEWRAYTHDAIQFDSGRLAFVEEQISHLSRHVFGVVIHPRDLCELVDNLHDENMLRRAGFPDGRSVATGASQLLVDYLTDSQLFKRGHQTLWVDTASESQAVETLQNWVRQVVANQGIVVEINPTSNLLIGNLGDLRNHPLWRLRPPIENPKIKNSIKVCIGSDDPITFATSLPQEYMLLYDSLILSGVDSDQADDWIDHARATGLNHRFTLADWKLPSNLPVIGMLNSHQVAPILFGKPLWQ